MFYEINKKDFGPPKYWEKVLSRKKEIRKFEKIKNYQKKVSQFTPYQNNGGTVIALATKNFCIVASDTRFTNGFSVPIRNTNRIIKLSSYILLSTAGMQADLLSLQNELREKIENFEMKDERNFSISNCSFFLSSILYSRRFFPFFTFNILSGLERNGEGVNFSFDAIGSFEKNYGSCKGKGEQLIQGLLDSQTFTLPKNFKKLSQQITNHVALAKIYFLKAAARGISIGDGLQVFILTKKGILIENNFLKGD